MKKKITVLLLVMILCLTASGCIQGGDADTNSIGGTESTNSINSIGGAGEPAEERTSAADADLQNIPPYTGEPYIVLKQNRPGFDKEELTAESYERYGPLDALGRCTAAEASIGRDCMPTKKRGSIGQVKPSGWKTVRYDFVDGKYLYNRCHLIGYQLTAENANERNLITGTRAMNVDGMLPFEDMVADYIKETGNHVMYRVTPIYKGNNLVASGVEMEGMSVEDEGAGISFHIYAYNNQPGVTIDYATGDSRLQSEKREQKEQGENEEKQLYVVNTNTEKFHKPDCASVSQMKDSNRKKFRGKRQQLVEQGYEPCANCRP